MRIKIAVIGSEHFCRRAEDLSVNEGDFELACHIYTDPKEAADIIKTLKPSDAILFSGSLPYAYAKEAVQQFIVPTFYLKQDETAVSTTLLSVLANERVSCERISIDVAEQSHIDHVLNDLNGTIELPYIHVLQNGGSIEDVINFHKRLSGQGKTDIAITSIHIVYEKLLQRGITARMMIDPESSIIRSLRLAKQKAMLQKSSSAQIAVGILQSSGLPIMPFVTELSTILQAHWSETDGEFSLFTTKGIVEHSIKNPGFMDVFHRLPRNVKMAFGYGETTMKAAEHARLALNFIQSGELNSFYILDSNKRLHGPYPQSDGAIDMKVDHPLLVEIAEKTKLGPANISKLVQFSQSRTTNQFSAIDLALYMNVSRRTAERTLKKLIEFEYVRIVGEEMTYKQGRPRSLYEMNFAVHY
ncbi:transcriptional regulator [Sporosarcina sp. Marseille-Q4943]|uniref:transcriptional regulator n=1 Tax=Sporosarcina sp. Marseille-Q4943 TaxID=2942204 RepID=UPI00208DD4E9|nr:transcriptional regulator [Sporosarcina sp. Marseille-Q4943]